MIAPELINCLYDEICICLPSLDICALPSLSLLDLITAPPPFLRVHCHNHFSSLHDTLFLGKNMIKPHFYGDFEGADFF